MSPSTTPATQNEGRCRQAPRLPHKMERHHQALHQRQPSATSATDGRCHQVPRLPHKLKKCDACHATWSGVSGNQACHQSQPSAKSATPTTQNESRCHQVPRLPHRMKVDVPKCYACHTKWSGVTENQVRHQSQPGATSATPDTQSV